MSYPKPPRFCRGCGADARTGEKISYNGYCLSCSTERAADAIVQMANRKGKIAEKWLNNMAKAVERLEEEGAVVSEVPNKFPPR